MIVPDAAKRTGPSGAVLADLLSDAVGHAEARFLPSGEFVSQGELWERAADYARCI